MSHRGLSTPFLSHFTIFRATPGASAKIKTDFPPTRDRFLLRRLNSKRSLFGSVRILLRRSFMVSTVLDFVTVPLPPNRSAD